jgi:hypothetical protein
MKASTKPCTKCCIIKPLVEFNSGRGACKSCRAKDEHARRHPSSTPNEIRSNNIRLITAQTQKIQNILLENMSVADECEQINECIAELYRLTELAARGVVLELKLKVPETLHKFLIQMKDGDVRSNLSCLSMAKARLGDKFKDGFEKHYKMNREELLGYLELIERLQQAEGFVRTVYWFMAHDYIAEQNSEYNSVSEHIPETKFINSSFIRYDAASDSVVAEGNPLRHDCYSFMAKLNEMMENEHQMLQYQIKYYYVFCDLLAFEY